MEWNLTWQFVTENWWNRIEVLGVVGSHQKQPRTMKVHISPISCLCKACRSAAVKSSPETAREVALETAVKFLVIFCCSSFLRKRSSKVPGVFHDKVHATFHQTLCSRKCPISWRFSLCRCLSLRFRQKSQLELQRAAQKLRVVGSRRLGVQNYTPTSLPSIGSACFKPAPGKGDLPEESCTAIFWEPPCKNWTTALQHLRDCDAI